MARNPSPILIAFLASACSIGEPTSSPVHTDLSGTWPVTFQEIRHPNTAEPCVLAGMNLIVVQDGGRESGNSWRASFHGTYTGGTITCSASSTPSQESGTLTG